METLEIPGHFPGGMSGQLDFRARYNRGCRKEHLWVLQELFCEDVLIISLL